MKKILLMLAIIALFLAMSGCAGTDDSLYSSTSQPTLEKAPTPLPIPTAESIPTAEPLPTMPP